MPRRPSPKPSTTDLSTISSLSSRSTRLLRDLNNLMRYNAETITRYRHHAERNDLLAEKKLEMRIALAGASKKAIISQKTQLLRDMARAQRAISSSEKETNLAKRLAEVQARAGVVVAKIGGYFSVEIFSKEVVGSLAL